MEEREGVSETCIVKRGGRLSVFGLQSRRGGGGGKAPGGGGVDYKEGGGGVRGGSATTKKKNPWRRVTPAPALTNAQ